MCDYEQFSVITSAIVVDRNLDYKDLKDLLMEKIDLLPFCLVIHYSVFAVLLHFDGNSFMSTWII